MRENRQIPNSAQGCILKLTPTGISAPDFVCGMKSLLPAPPPGNCTWNPHPEHRRAVPGMATPLTEGGNPTDVDLVAGCTVHINDQLISLQKAAASAR